LIIQALDLTNFRNIESAALTFSETFNVVRGRNAQGKTNLLEAIHLFSLGRSFRTRKSDEMIMFGREYLFARMSCLSDMGVRFRIEIGLERGGRISASVNGKKLSGLGEIIGIIPTVIFAPQDVTLASGPPADRRVYIDYTAAQISPSFLQNLREYRRVLGQRNSLLRQAAESCREPKGIEAWDDMLVERGAAIVEGRREMLGEIQTRAERLFGEIVPEGGSLRMEYRCSFRPDEGDAREALADAIRRLREQERRRGYTLAGPHYDDIEIFLGDEELKRYGSQGRKRLASIILKLAQAWAIMERRAERPVVLLDDIFSELDAETGERVSGLLTDRYQSFITTPRSDDFNGIGGEGFEVDRGRVVKAGAS
jgi:DNA replication and repair protein RecF